MTQGKLRIGEQILHNLIEACDDAPLRLAIDKKMAETNGDVPIREAHAVIWLLEYGARAFLAANKEE